MSTPPFFYADLPPTRGLPVRLVDNSVSVNLELFKNPVPFNRSDWAKPQRVVNGLPDASRQLNLNLQKNPVPFNQTDWSQSRRVVFETQVPDGLNPNLQKNNVPFNQTDWSLPVRVAHVTPDASRGLNPNLVPAAVLPFNQTDWTASRRLVAETQVPDGLNLNLFTNPVPFGAADTGAHRLAALTPPDQPYNVALYTVTNVAAPFTQSDFAVAMRPKLTTAPASAFNPNLSTNDMPFSQFDWSPAHRVPAAPIELSRGQPNPNIFTNPMPFLQSDFAAPRSLPRAPRLDAINVALLGTPIIIVPLPFNQYNFTPPTKPQPQRRQDLLNPTLIASFVPPPPDAEQHSKPFFATPGRLMNI